MATHRIMRIQKNNLKRSFEEINLGLNMKIFIKAEYYNPVQCLHFGPNYCQLYKNCIRINYCYRQYSGNRSVVWKTRIIILHYSEYEHF
jgi:hypothetical protein